MDAWGPLYAVTNPSIVLTPTSTGAPPTTGSPLPGRVALYRDDSLPEHLMLLQAPAPASRDMFGYAVSLAGWDHRSKLGQAPYGSALLAVGSPGLSSGQAYTFWVDTEELESTAMQTFTLNPPPMGSKLNALPSGVAGGAGKFGWSVASRVVTHNVPQAYDDESDAIVAVGAPDTDSGGGLVFVFEARGLGPFDDPSGLASASAAMFSGITYTLRGLGGALAIDKLADWDSTLMAATAADTVTSDVRVCLFLRAAHGSWSHLATLSDGPSAPYSPYGSSLALLGSTLAVGLQKMQTSDSGGGSATTWTTPGGVAIWRRVGATSGAHAWQFFAVEQPSALGAEARVGHSVALQTPYGALRRSQQLTRTTSAAVVAVGAPRMRHGANAQDSGAVLGYLVPASVPVVGLGATPGGSFTGASVAALRGVIVAAGEPTATHISGSSQSGRAVVWYKQPSGSWLASDLWSSSPVANGACGTAVAMSAVGILDVLVMGCPGEQAAPYPPIPSGVLYVFTRASTATSTHWSAAVRLVPQGLYPNAGVGSTLALSASGVIMAGVLIPFPGRMHSTSQTTTETNGFLVAVWPSTQL